MFQLTFEDDEILHLQDPQTGEISKDNFVSYSLERKLLDAQDTSARRKKMKKEDELNRKERLLRRQASFVQPSPVLPEPEKNGEETESRSLFCCARPTVERDLSPPSLELELQVRGLTSIGGNKSTLSISGSEPGEDCICLQKV